MNRYYKIKEIVNDFLTNRDDIEHSISVATMATLLAKIDNLDMEIAAIIGICHDLAKYKYNSSFDHANRSSLLAKEIISSTKLFSNEEIILITTAIKNHSAKEKIDDKYSELIKNADLLVQYLNEPEAILPTKKQNRLNNILKRDSFK